MRHKPDEHRQKKSKDTISQRLSCAGISIVCKGLRAVAYVHLPAVEKQQGPGRQIWAGGSVPDKRGQAELERGRAAEVPLHPE